jgi:hypothetical protein
MRQAVDAGVTEAAVVVVEARRIADQQPAAQVIPIGALTRFDRPRPVLVGYDTLLADQAGGQPDQAGGRGQPYPEVVGAEADATAQAEEVGV